ncbi:hypothetical protein HUJ04_012107 [Dendroctonus ponderosae]|nr:hypothetical protein HUJ04_012107 [Dendroctonus ponderosae]
MKNCLSVGAVHRESKKKFKEKERNNSPAFRKECNFCHIKNHFESKCLKKKYKRDVQEITEEMGEIREEQTSQVYKKKLNIKQTEQPYENHYSLPAGKNVKNNAIDNKNRGDEVKYFIELDIEPEKRETQNDAYLCMNSGNDSDEVYDASGCVFGAQYHSIV